MTGGTRARWVWFVLLLVAPLPVCAASPHLDLEARLDVERRTLRVSGSMSLPAQGPLRVWLWGASKDVALTLEGGRVQAERVQSRGTTLLRWDLPPPTASGARIRFAYTIALEALDTALDHRQVLGLNAPVAAAEGVFVPAAAAWYPQPETEAMTHRITLEVVGRMRALVPGRLVEEHSGGDRYRAVFESTVGLPGIDLLAGPYRVEEKHVVLGESRSVRVRTYFHEELQDLAPSYLDAAANYLARYDRLVGPYRYASYSMVSAPIPTGFGMPGIAYLGRQVLRLPFIRATSLGHEVLHDWWGNGVYPDYAQGNWSEGLTTFLADYAFKEDEGDEPARTMREAWLRDYAAIPAGHERALSEFVARRHGADQALGYNKTAFVFFMLRDWIGDAAFLAGLRLFWQDHAGRAAGWDALQRAFEAASGRDLRAFFEQWVRRAGAPRLRVTSARRVASGATGEAVRIVLAQQAPAYRLRVPVRIYLRDGGSHDATVDLAGSETRIEVALPARATSVALDPDARVFRRVDPDEIAPILRPTLLDPRTRVVLDADAVIGEAAAGAVRAMLEGGVRTVDADAARATTEPLVVAAQAARIPALLARLGLPPLPEALARREIAFAYAGRTAQGRNYVVVSAPDAAAMSALARPLPHLGAQSFALFEGARSVSRGVWPAQQRRVPVEGP